MHDVGPGCTRTSTYSTIQMQTTKADTSQPPTSAQASYADWACKRGWARPRTSPWDKTLGTTDWVGYPAVEWDALEFCGWVVRSMVVPHPYWFWYRQSGWITFSHKKISLQTWSDRFHSSNTRTAWTPEIAPHFHKRSMDILGCYQYADTHEHHI